MARNKKRFSPKGQPSQTILRVETKCQLLDFLLEKLKPMSKTSIKEVLRSGRVVVGQASVSQFDTVLEPNTEVRILPKPHVLPGDLKTKDLKIIYEDNDVVVVNKKEGLLSVGTLSDKQNTAYHYINEHVKTQGYGRHVYVVHRLDRKTSGVMMFAKTAVARDTLRENWHQMVVERSYYAVVEGVLDNPRGQIKSYLWEDKMLRIHSSDTDNGGQLAITNYEVLQSNGVYSLVKLDLETGRKNQIRAHMQHIGHSVAGDIKYGATTDPAHRVCLHAATLSFQHPTTGKELSFEVPVPKVFYKLVE